MKYLIVLLVLVQNFVFGQNFIGCKVMPSQPTTSSTSVKRGSNTLMDNYDVKYYNIDLNVSNTSLAINGFVQMKAQAKKDGFNQVVLNLANAFTVDSVYINGKKVTYSKSGDELTIQATTNFIKNQYFESIVYYRGNGSAGTDFPAGMNLGTQGNNSYLYTVSEPYHSYLWWPCKQDLLDKADSAAINITTKGTNLVASNGVLQKTTTIGADKRFEWKTRYPIAYYLLTFSAGPYVEYKTYANPAGFSKPILIQAFVYDQAYLTSNKAVIDQTALLIEKFSEKFGLYPFAEEKYGYYTAPFKYGALENQTMTMMNGFNFDLVAHELSHQWFGNNVTCTDWSQIWLHEGMADFCESVANEIVYGENNRQSSISASQTNVLAVPTNCATIKNTHIPMNIFNKTNAYSKGATVMNMLRFEIGDDITFFGMLKEYQKKFAGKNANTDSLSLFIKGYTGKDFSTFFNQWIVGTGFPSYTFSSYQRGDTLYVTSNQTTSSTLTPLYAMKMDFNLVNSTGGVTYVTDYQKKSNETFKFLVKNQRITSVKPNPKVWSLYTNNSGSSITPLSGDNFITAFTIPSAISSKITGTNIDVVMPYGTSLNSLKATFTASAGATVKIGTTSQTSGTSITNFSSVVLYTVTAQNGMIQTYRVQVTNAKNSAKEITAFSFNGFTPDITGTILGTNITATVPYGTDVSKLVATFTTSAKANVSVGLITQISGSTANDFTKSVTYTVTAEDGTIQEYVVTVTIAPAPKSSEKVINTFGFEGLTPVIIASVSGTNITATVPFGTDVIKLVATFTASAKANVSVGLITQISGSTANDFTKSVTYTVTAEDGTIQEYVVTVTIAPAPKSSEKVINTFSFEGLLPVVKATILGTNITATVPFGTDVSKLVATFTASAKANVSVGLITQISGSTANDFTKSLTYTVTAEDGTIQEYVVTVTIAPAPKSSEKVINTFGFEGLTPVIIASVSGINITATVPFGTDVTKLVATFTASAKANVSVGLITQISGSTANDFSKSVTYTVTAEDGTIQEYVVTVTIAPAPKSSEKVINTFSFEGLLPVVKATILGTNITATVPFGTDVTKLVASFTASAKATVSIGSSPQTSGSSINDFTKSVTYTVTAEDSTTKTYVVTVTIDKNPLGIENLEKATFTVFPNPSSGNFYVEAESGTLVLRVTDLQGRIVYQLENNSYTGAKLHVDLSPFGASTYLIHLTNNGRDQLRKIEVVR